MQRNRSEKPLTKVANPCKRVGPEPWTNSLITWQKCESNMTKKIKKLRGSAAKPKRKTAKKTQGMSRVRLLVGTKKGAFVLTSDGKRKQWDISGPHFAGWEIYHVKGSAVEPNRLFASQTSGWFGQIIQRSDDGGKTWQPPGSSPEELTGPGGTPKGESNKFVYEGEVGTHKWDDGTQQPWESKRMWHPEPSLKDPDAG